MNILFFSTVYPDRRSPTRGTYNWELCRALGRRHSVRVISPRSWLERLTSGPAVCEDMFALAGRSDCSTTNCTRALPPQEPSVNSSNSPAVTFPLFFHLPKLFLNQLGWFLWKSVREHIGRVCREFQPEVVLSYWAHPDGEVAARTAATLGIPSAVIVGGSDVLLLTRKAGRRRRVVQALRQCDGVLCVSNGLAEAVAELGIDRQKIFTFQQGVDPNLFRPGSRSLARRQLGIAEERQVLLWVGRMVPVKALNVLLEAFALACRWNPLLHLYLLGDGPERGRVQRLVKVLQLQERVHLVGAVEHSKTAQWYRAANATVLASWSEGLPNVLRESLACGTPFVSTNVGSVAEIADPGCSILVPPGNVETLADALLRIGQEPYQLNAAHYKPTTWDQTAEQVAVLLKQLCRQKTAEPSQESGFAGFWLTSPKPVGRKQTKQTEDVAGTRKATEGVEDGLSTERLTDGPAVTVLPVVEVGSGSGNSSRALLQERTSKKNR